MSATRDRSAMAVVRPGADVAALVRSVRGSLDPAAASPFAAADAHRLYSARAPAPIAALLASKSHLIVAANGPLSALPFTVLVTRAGARPLYLVDCAAVSHVSGPAALLRPAGASAPRGGGFLAFGSPAGGVGSLGATALRSAGAARAI